MGIITIIIKVIVVAICSIPALGALWVIVMTVRNSKEVKRTAEGEMENARRLADEGKREEAERVASRAIKAIEFDEEISSQTIELASIVIAMNMFPVTGILAILIKI